MLLSLSIVFILGLLANKLFTTFKLPGFLGMFLVGIVIGPNFLNIISPELLSFSSDLRKLALIIILLRAGLSLGKSQLMSNHTVILKMSIIPCIIEGATIAIASIYIFGFSIVQGGMLGFIIAAVSPAVVIPAMLELQKNSNTKKVSTIILAGASVENVLAITLFSTFLGFYENVNTDLLLKLSKFRFQ